MQAKHHNEPHNIERGHMNTRQSAYGDVLAPSTVQQDLRYSRKEVVPIEIEAWVTHRDDCFVRHFSEPKDKEWKASVKHINGVTEQEWCTTLEEAVAWCDKYFLSGV